MPRRAIKHPEKAEPGISLPLMLVDGTRIRRRIKREYEKVVHDLSVAREELDRFHKKDLPGFTRWLNSQFGVLLTELRGATRRVAELEQLLSEVYSEILFSGASPSVAYSRVMNYRENPKSRPDGEDESSNEEGTGNGPGSSGHHRRDDEAGPDFGDFFGYGQEKNTSRSKRKSSTSVVTRLKELYRSLARRLHPDAQNEITPQKKEWWHQAQTAYEAGDVEQLEVILSLCEIEETGTTEKTSLSVLQRISAQLKKSLRQLKAQLTKHRRDPAWNFGARADKHAMAVTMRRQLNQDLNRIKIQLHQMESQVATWAEMAKRRRSNPSRRRRRVVSDPFESLF